MKNSGRLVRRIFKWSAAGVGIAACTYGSLAGAAWFQYGRKDCAAAEDSDALLNRFVPDCDVAERHRLKVSVPADLAFRAMIDVDLEESGVLRTIFRTRELVLGGKAINVAGPKSLLAQTKAMGWGVLAEIPGAEIVMGAVTQPWIANPVFKPLPPNEFAAFDEPGYVKIVWTLRVDRIGPSESMLRTETRASATDPAARAHFRRYWAFVSPGVVLIRWVALRLAREGAERLRTG